MKLTLAYSPSADRETRRAHLRQAVERLFRTFVDRPWDAPSAKELAALATLCAEHDLPDEAMRLRRLGEPNPYV